LLCAVFDSAAGLILGYFAAWHALLALRNATTLAPTERRWDVGRRRNWEQVFGRRPALWPLPLLGQGPAVDGLSWPLNPACKEVEGVP
jgi:hypothetical protein